jgi:hypothetical protein
VLPPPARPIDVYHWRFTRPYTNVVQPTTSTVPECRIAPDPGLIGFDDQPRACIGGVVEFLQAQRHLELRVATWQQAAKCLLYLAQATLDGVPVDF